MATGIDRFNEIYDNGIKSGENKGKAVKNSEQVDRFNAMYERSGAGYIAYKKYMENAAKLSQEIQSDYADRAGQWQSAEALAQNKADTLAAFDQLGNKDALLNYGYAISDPKQRRAYSDSILSVDDLKRGFLHSHDNMKDFYGQWKSDDEYKKSEAYFVNTYNDSLPDWEEKSKANRELAGEYGKNEDQTYYYLNNFDVKSAPIGLFGSEVAGDFKYRDAMVASGKVTDKLLPLSSATDDDRNRYNYIYAKEGRDRAEEYLSVIANKLRLKEGEAMANRFIDDNNLVSIATFPILQGLDQFTTGIKGLVSGEEVPISILNVAGEKIKENINTFEVFGKDFGQVMYDLGTTTANMIPSIVIDRLLGGTGIAGSFLMGASAAGNARQEALRQGYTQEQAWAYGLTVGTLEGCLQNILGGIKGLGGKGSSFVLKKLGSTSAGQAVSRYVANLSNGTLSAVLQAGGKLAGNMASEGFEEYLQDVINPLVRNITLGEDNEWGLKNFVSEDAIYSGILGALSAGLLEGGSTVSGVYNAHKAGQAALDSGVYKGAIDYAKLLDPECDAYQIASELQSGKRKENAANIGALYEAISEYMAESKKLVKKGKMTTDQYAGGVEALRQLADVRAGADIRRAQQTEAAPSAANVQTAANAASAPILDSAVYDAVKAVESNENSAVKAANIIARIESGNSKISAAELSYISSPATKARQILQQRTGIDMGTTASQARNAVKEYISQRSASVSQETVNKRSAELRGAKAQSIAANSELNASLGFDTGTVGNSGTEAYTNHYSALKTEQGQRYFNSAFAKLYQAGMQGIPFKKVSGNADLQGMSVSTQAEIYNAAVKDYQAVNQIKAETKKAVHDRVKEIRQKVKEQKNGKAKKEYAEIDKKLLEKREVKAGTFTVDERIDRAKLSSKQKAAVKYLQALSEVAGVNVNIYSGVDQNGAVTAENGYYDPQTNTIYVSANAGMSSVNAFAESAILRTASHEITHMIKASGTELYVDLRDYVIDTYVQEYGQNGLAERILEIQERHREIVGKELTYEQAEEELVSSACEMMLKDSKAFEKLAKRNLTLAQRVKSTLDAFISRAQKMLSEAFKGNSANSAEARLMQASVERMEKLQQLWDRALLDAVSREAQKKENIKFSFAGTAAKNANLSLLAQAQIKIENGANAETVRQETGWYKGYDGKWRFEVDDSGITLKENDITSGTAKIGDVLADCELLKAYPQLKDITISARPMLLMGDTNGWYSAVNHEIVLNSRFLENAQANHALEALYKTNEYKEYNAQMKKAADERSAKRSEIVKEYQAIRNSKEYADYTEQRNKADDADNKALMNRIEHQWRASERGKRFYELQKQLKEITEDRVLERITDEFQRTETGKRYLELVHASEGNDIVNNEATKKVLLHELQHAVQQIEKLASGASPEFWIEQTKNAEMEFKKADIRLDKKADSVLEVLERYGFKELNHNDFYLLSEEGMEAAREFLERADAPRGAMQLLEQLKECQTDRNRAYEYFRSLDKAAPTDLYIRTAGEIEARDAAARLSYDMEKRRNTRPDIDQKGVVFADGEQVFCVSSEEKGTIKEQLKAHLTEINKMNPVATVINEGRMGMSREQQVAAIMSDYNKKFKGGVPRQNWGFVEINENLVRGSLRYIYTDAEYAAFYAIPNVIKNGIEISEHKNHKGRSYETITIAAPVNINGSRGNVAVVIKQTGKNRYKTHRILMPDGSEFVLQNIKNEEFTGADMLANNHNQGTAINSSFAINIPNSDENVNKKLELLANPAQEKFEKDKNVNREQAQASRYSYDALVSKPDMQVTPLRSVSPEKLQEYVADHRKFAREMMQLARKADHARNTEKTTWLRNNDLNSDIMVSTESFKHSAARMDAAYVRVCMSMSDIVRNAVAVNELPPRQNTAGAYVLLGMAHDGNEYTAVRMVVNKKTWKMEDYHILYAARETQIKEKVSGSLPPGSSTRAISGNLLSPKISIQGMLQLVKKNNLISSVLSEDVLQNLQATRGSDVLGESVLYELRSDPVQAEWEKPITAEDVNTLRSVGRKSVNEFTSEDIQKTQKWAHKFYKELGEKSPFFRAWFGDWRAYDTTPFRLKTLSSLAVLNRTEADIYFKKGLKDHSLFRGDVLNNDTKFKINIGQKVYNDTLTYAAREFSRNGDFNGYLNRISLLNNIAAITRDAVLFDTIVAKENSVNPDRSFVHQFYDVCRIGQQTFVVKLIVDELNSQRGTIRRSYNVNSIEISPAAVSQVYKPASTASNSGDVVSVHSIADLFALVKENDPAFRPKTAAAALLNANGTPQQLYRWESANGARTNFGEGAYFTASKALAERAGGKAAPAYVKLENPYTVYGTAFSKADYAEIGVWAGMQVSAKNVTEALQALGYDGVISRSTAGNHRILAAVAFDTAQTKSSENVGTFDSSNADIRYELRENEQGELNDNEIKSIHRTRGIAVIEQILNQAPKGERQSLTDVFSRIYSKAINAESVHDLESLNGEGAFSKQELQLIYDAAKEDVQNYKLYKKEFFSDLDERLNELKSKPDYSQEIGEQGKLFENLEDRQPREIVEYNELTYKGNPEEVKKEIEKLSAQKREAIKFLDKLCQVSGIKIEIGLNENPDETADGGYSDYEKIVRISVDKEGIKRGIETGVLDTAAHEITHMLRHEALEQYNALSDLVTQSYIQETSKEAYIGEIKGIIERYNTNNEHAEYLSYEQAENEFVCYACESMLRNSTVFENLAMRNQTLAQKVADGLHNFIEKVKALLLQLRKRLFVWQGKNSLKKGFKGMEGLSDVAEVLARRVETLNEAQKRWDAAFIKAVENRTRFVADENYFRNAVSEWEEVHPNETISFAEEEKLKRGVAKQLLQNWAGEIPISGKLTQVEKVFSGEYEENGTGYWSQAKEGRYNEKKNENGQTIEFELGATKYTKFFSYGTQESLDNVINKNPIEAKRLKANGEISLEAALQNAKTFFRCEIPVRMEKGHDYIVEAIVSFPAEKKKLNRTVNYEHELNKIIKEAMRTGNPVIDSTADRIFDDMVLYDVIKVVEETDESGIANAPSALTQNQPFENVGTFNSTNADVRYELRENGQKEVWSWEFKRINSEKGFEVLEKQYRKKDAHHKISEDEKVIWQNEFWRIYNAAINAKSVNDIVDASESFSHEDIQDIFDAAKKDVEKYFEGMEQYRLKYPQFFADLKERLKELKTKSQKDFSQEIGELGKLIEEIDKQPKQEITEYEEIILPGNFDNLSPRLQNGIDFLDKLCQAAGIRMEVQYQTEALGADKNLDEAGRYNPFDRKVYLYIDKNGITSEKASSGMLRTAAHEITHWIQAINPEIYELLHNYVIQSYIQEKGIEQYERRIQVLKEVYDKDDPNRSVRNIEEEFVAYACEMMLENTKAFEKLVNQNRTLAQKLAEGLHNFIEKVKELLLELRKMLFIGQGKDNLQKGFEGVKAGNDISQFFAKFVEKLEYMQKLWDGALMQAVANKSVASVKLEGIKRFESLSKSRQLNAVKAELSKLSGQVPISGTLTQMERKSSDFGKYGNNLNGQWNQASQREYTEMWDEKGLIEFELGSTKYTRLYNVKKDLNESGEISLEEAESSVKTFFRCSVPIQIEGKEYVADVIVGFPEELDVWGDKINTQEAVKEVLENRKQGEVLIDPTDYNLFYNFVLYDVLEIREKN